MNKYKYEIEKLTKEQSDTNLRIIKALHHRSLIDGFIFESNLTTSELSVEYESVQHTYADIGNTYVPTIIIYDNDHTILSIMTDKKAYEYIRIGDLKFTLNQVMNSVGWD